MTSESPVRARVSARIDVNSHNDADILISLLSAISVEQMRGALNNQYMIDSINGPTLESVTSPVMTDNNADVDDTDSSLYSIVWDLEFSEMNEDTFLEAESSIISVV